MGKDLDLTPEEIMASLDPISSVKGKVTIGGPAPAEVNRPVAEAAERLAAEKARLAERKRRLAEADALLDGMAAQLLAD